MDRLHKRIDYFVGDTFYSDDYPSIADRIASIVVHEVGHTIFGEEHQEDPNNIMYFVPSCNSVFSIDQIQLMQELFDPKKQ